MGFMTDHPDRPQLQPQPHPYGHAGSIQRADSAGSEYGVLTPFLGASNAVRAQQVDEPWKH